MKMIKQTLYFKINPIVFYKTYLDEKAHREFTGAHVHINDKVGEHFSAWDGYACGENLELISGKKIVQSWKPSTWEKGRISKITFILSVHEKGTKLEFTHEGLIDNQEVKEFSDGWNEYYWKPISKYFEDKK